jgi:hypothetical protein
VITLRLTGDRGCPITSSTITGSTKARTGGTGPVQRSIRRPGPALRKAAGVGPCTISAIAPSVADKIAMRYTTNKIYTTRAVADGYPQPEKALLHYESVRLRVDIPHFGPI